MFVLNEGVTFVSRSTSKAEDGLKAGHLGVEQREGDGQRESINGSLLLLHLPWVSVCAFWPRQWGPLLAVAVALCAVIMAKEVDKWGGHQN